MHYLDSWVWLEYVFGGDADAEAETALENAREDDGLTSTIALTEIDYILRRDLDTETADYVTSSIEDDDSVRVVPVSSEIALHASNIRSKYYQRRERELSYADALHISTAIITECDVIHTGDSDFEALEEIETVVY
ncbi:hypothetical protein HALLA_05090 [Halostagnicola larsenii XH-48]|uniref:PIN domain-containing protein n=1 Tax=Halostagnicola larsenii XH-48 TaxID=797299 RepID=W0JTR6_9EURY|nr:PIN domain-containing protein [Halostagnicola larsenii]AHG00702.1 hypothetical protein HALLA_05090 [Halostagnicola larsenii XH-48]